MTNYENSLAVLNELFGKDCFFTLATSKDNVPSQRVVDTFYTEGAFWIVTYALSRKAKEIKDNPNVSLCNNFYNFSGKAYNVGHPLKAENKDIRDKLIKVFEPWYFAHNNEADENMCYVKFVIEKGFFYKNGTGHVVDFINKEVENFPFENDIIVS